MERMNKTLLASLLLVALAPGAQAEPGALQLYGRLNLALESVRQHGGDHAVRTSNYRSVFGLRGSEALGDGLRLLYQVESALAPDTGSGALAARDTRVGLEGRWGTLFAGNWSTPYNTASSSLDPFYPTTAGYMSIMGNGSAPSAGNLDDTASFDRRQRNSLHYWTPAWRGLTLRLAQGFNEERPPGGARPALTSGALQFERGPLYLALAHERHRDYQGAGLSDHGSKLALAWQFGTVRLALAGERLRYRSATGVLRRDAWFAAISKQAGAHALRLAVAKAGDGKGDAKERIGFIAAGPDTGALHATVGYDYTLSRRTSLFALHTRIRNREDGTVDFAINGLAPTPGAQLRGTALGIRHAF